jgi:hypothetical protein
MKTILKAILEHLVTIRDAEYPLIFLQPLAIVLEVIGDVG